MLQLAVQQETPYLAVLAHDGQAALRVAEHLKPNLFIIDYLLPDMTGLQVYERLHATPEFETIPAILLSAVSHVEELTSHAHVQVIAKPFELNDLLQAIREHLD